jgi:hypothetical protein
MGAPGNLGGGARGFSWFALGLLAALGLITLTSEGFLLRALGSTGLMFSGAGLCCVCTKPLGGGAIGGGLMAIDGGGPGGAPIGR